MPSNMSQLHQWVWRVISSLAVEKLDTKPFKSNFQNKWCHRRRDLILLFFNSRCIHIWELLCSAVTWLLKKLEVSMSRNVIHSVGMAESAKKENVVAAQTTTAIPANTREAQVVLSHSSFSFLWLHLSLLPLASCTPGTTCKKSKQL